VSTSEFVMPVYKGLRNALVKYHMVFHNVDIEELVARMGL